MKCLYGVSVRVTTQEKKMARTEVIAILSAARLKVFVRTGSRERSLNASIQPWNPQVTGCPGRLNAKLLRKIMATG